MIVNEKIFWIWISRLECITCEDVELLIEEYGNIKNIWNLKYADLIDNKYLSNIKKKRMMDKRLKENLWRYLEYLENNKIKIISYKDNEYPKKLRNIEDKPVVLYVKGNIQGIDDESVAIVGSRKCTQYGMQVTELFSKEFAKRNINIISGLARGIDAVAHKSAIENGAKTIAVLGHGLNFIYPKENTDLAMSILRSGGAIISEYLPGTPIRKEHFPRRNRIISGLSDIVIVTEASEKSGSLITANHAIEQGKEVWVVPGSILSEQSEGTNHLIKDGANILTNIEDICF